MIVHTWAHEKTDLRASAHGRRAQPLGGRAALDRRLCPPPVPDSARQRPGRAGAAHRRHAGLRRPDGPQRHPRLRDRGAGGLLDAGGQPTQDQPAKLDDAALEKLRALLHQSPRLFGQPTGVWTLALAAEVSFAEGITAEHVSNETIRSAIKRLGIGWKRATRWITSPDPEYARKKGVATV